MDNRSNLLAITILAIITALFAAGLYMKTGSVKDLANSTIELEDKENLPSTDSNDLLNKEQTMGDEKIYKVAMKTNMGEIELELYKEKAPLTVENFVKLANSGFYNGTKFHRVIKDFMIQGGDPNSKLADWSTHGMGGPGYSFNDETNDIKLVEGIIAMANSGPNTNGSQFFIITAKETPWLDGLHTAFGKVVGGMDIVKKIENVETDKSRGDHPVADVLVESITIK